MEIWKQIKEASRYAVSNAGRVKNTKTGRILKPTPDSCGYPQVSLFSGEGKFVRRSVHSLVANEFLNKKDNRYEVNHIDGIKANNDVSNLEWVTHLVNMRHANRLGLISNTGQKGHKGKGHSQLKVKVVETGQVFDSLYSCAESMGLDRGAISGCLRKIRNRKQHKGFTFEAVNE